MASNGFAASNQIPYLNATPCFYHSHAALVVSHGMQTEAHFEVCRCLTNGQHARNFQPTSATSRIASVHV
jgi:hypothetical protein